MRNMYKHGKSDLIVQALFYVVGIFILIKILIPIINPITTAADYKGQTNFYQNIIETAISPVKVAMNSQEDEDRKEMLPIIFKYLTNIDITNPKSYISSQIPLLRFIDLTSVAENETGPIMEIVPKEPVPDPIPKENNNSEDPNDKTPDDKVENPTQPNNPPVVLDPAKPLVLIYHTHTTESYNPLNVKGQNFSTNLEIGVSKVGEELKKELESKYGIPAIHEMTVHDLPLRDTGYSRSRVTLEKYIKKYPSLKIIIDLHRDGADRNVSTAKINGEYYSRIMFVVGKGNKKYAKNIASANAVNTRINELFPGLSRGFTYSTHSYNQDLSSNVMLMEVGSEESKLEETIRTSKIIARVISDIIKK
jgi:stage II sporulation protein P